jgi:hypothetical protein
VRCLVKRRHEFICVGEGGIDMTLECSDIDNDEQVSRLQEKMIGFEQSCG